MRIDTDERGTTIRTTIGGNTIKFNTQNYGGLYEVDFKVNASYNEQRENIDRRTGIEIALTVKRAFEWELQQRGDGVVYTTSAYTGDGHGAQRPRAYERMGFGTRAIANMVGLSYRGEDGRIRLRPMTEPEYQRIVFGINLED